MEIDDSHASGSNISRGRMTFSRGQKILTLALFCAVCVAAYANVLNTFFLSDDFTQIGRVLEGDLSVTWGRDHGGFFRPLFILSYVLDVALWGRLPFGFHLTNLTLHALNSFLVVLLSARLLEHENFSLDARRRVALSAGLLFLVHPSHAEAVTWISGRADLLSALFCLLSLLAFVRYARGNRKTLLALSLGSFVLALLAKEAAVCLPLLTFVVGIYEAKRRNTSAPIRGTVKNVAPFFAVLAAYVAARALALGALVGGYGAGQHLNFTHSVVVSQLLRFFLRALFPAVALRSMTFLESKLLSPILIATGCVVVVVAAIILLRARTRTALAACARRNALLWTALTLFICALLPAINLRVNVFDTHGERFLYLPSAFFSAALAFLLGKLLLRNSKLWVAALACVLLFDAASLWRTNEIWREAATLSRSMLDEMTKLSERESILVLNAPDTLRGVHLYRNGLEDALRTFQRDKQIARARVVSFFGIENADDEVQVLKDEVGVYSLRLLNERTTFERVVDAPPGCVEVIERTPNLLRLRLDGCERELDVFYFSAGRIWRLRN